MAAKLKKGDRVVVIAGRDRGTEGEIERVMPKDGKAIVSGVNMVTRHQRQTAQGQGGRIRKETAIDLSNLALVDPKDGGPTRVGFKEVDGKKVRYAKKSGEIVDA